MQGQVEASSVRPPAMEGDPLTSRPPLPFQVRQLPVVAKVAYSELHYFAGLGSGFGSRLEVMNPKPKID
jgi:hypothetical protein